MAFCRKTSRLCFCSGLPSYTLCVPSPAQPPPSAEPVKVEVIGARDAGWWITTLGPILIAALALVVAILSVLEQHGADQATQTAAARTYASEVSFFQSGSQFEINNNAAGQIHLVLVQSAAHQSLLQLGTIASCRGVIFSLHSASNPVIYFQDANGLGWELSLNGAAEPSAQPSAIISLLPAGAVGSFPSAAEQENRQFSVCS
jgi:hypothetical protein